MDHVTAGLVGLVIVGLIVAGLALLLFDFRHFSTIGAACERVGYIQNASTRIYCFVEKD